MTKIKYFNIDSKNDLMRLSIEGDSHGVFLYRNGSSTGIDVTALVIGGEAIIPKSVYGDSTGVWEARTGGASKLAVDFSKYYDCLVRKVLKMKVDGCKLVADSSCGECQDSILYTYSLLDIVERAVKHGYSIELSAILEQIDELCEDCSESSSSNSKCGCNG